MLSLVSTPIGNLSDISFRAIETLQKVAYILCEDTRTSKTLCTHHGVDTPLRSFHKFNEAEQEDAIISELKNNVDIALISDAGTPGINDPGARLVSRCHDEGIPVSSIPGPSASIMALTLSGLPTNRFQFLGFVPKKPGERKSTLLDAFFYPGTSIFFESPNRIHQTLKEIEEMAPAMRLSVARELTKKFEEVIRGTAAELLTHELRGEIVLMLEGNMPVSFDLSIEEHLELLINTFSLTRPDAIKLLAKQRELPKRALYKDLT